MNRKSSISYLKKLYVLLDRLMGETILGTKYTRSLKFGINSLEKNDLIVENGTFKVNIKKNVDNITIDVEHKSGQLIDSHKYDSESILSTNIIGKT